MDPVAHDIAHPKKRAFLVNYALTGNISAACQAAEVGRRTYYDWTEHDETFTAATRVAKEEAADYLEEVARKRAVECSDTLLIFLLKGLRPEKYRERFDVQTSQIPVTEVDREAYTQL